MKTTTVLTLYSNLVESVVRKVSVWGDVTASLFCRVSCFWGYFFRVYTYSFECLTIGNLFGTFQQVIVVS